MGTTASSEQITNSDHTIEWYPISLLQRPEGQDKKGQDEKAGFALVVLNQPFADTHLGLIQKLWKNGGRRLTHFVLLTRTNQFKPSFTSLLTAVQTFYMTSPSNSKKLTVL